jgi:hypothetical protein
MARSVTDIKQYMTDFFMQNEAVRNKYALDEPSRADKKFEQLFKATSIESILLGIVAYCVYTLEKLFDLHQSEVNRLLDERLTHNLLWYAQKIMQWRWHEGTPCPLVEGSDQYDDTGFTEDAIKAMQIITIATTEDNGAGAVLIKVATGEAGSRAALTADQLTQLRAYVNEIKDAGVVSQIVSGNGTPLKVQATVYYEPTKLQPMQVLAEKAVKNLVDTMNFNAALTRNQIEDAMQSIDGIRIVNITGLQYKTGAAWQAFGLQKISEYGYFTAADEDLTINYVEYAANNL